jgi:type III pantothenate kinase
METDSRRTTDEYAVLISELFALEGLPSASVTDVVATCVVPTLTPVIAEYARRTVGHEPLIVGPGTRTGMDVRYDPPAALGGDRLVDAVAAREHYGAPVVVVDFGTATSFNVVDRSGAFVGGAIAPGVGLAAEALAEAGARLRRIDLPQSADVPVVGRNTAQSMRAGVLYGCAGLVTGLLARFDAELGPGADGAEVPVVATGGMAGLVAPLVDRIGAVEPNLTLEGLRIVAELNGIEA